MVRSHANLLKQKEVFTQEKSSVHTGLVWYTNMVAISLFWNNNMAAVTSCENALLRYCYNTLLSNFDSILCQVIAYGRLKTKENFRLLALKVVAVAYERWSLTRGSK